VIHVFTIALDAMPWLGCQLVELNRLTVPWHWSIVEGVSAPVADTAWMRGQPERLSRDGTHEFLMDLAHHPRITVISKPRWEGKVQMCNAALPEQECVLLQADSDEIWTAANMTALLRAFEADPELAVVQVQMRYFLGPNIISTSEDGYGNRKGEWVRAWRFRPGMRWNRHEPPVLANNRGKRMGKEESAQLIGTIDHYAWATSKQAKTKEELYGYNDALARWMALQAAKMPVRDLQRHLPWVGQRASAGRVFENDKIQP